MNLPPPAPRPRVASLFMATPIVFAGLLIIGVVGLIMLGFLGGSADGERLTVTFTTNCTDAAEPMLSERVAAIGLGEPVWNRTGTTLSLTATMPGLPDDRTAVPSLLAQTGQLEIHADGAVIATSDDIQDASLEFDEGGRPLTQLDLNGGATEKLSTVTQGAPEGTLRFFLDEKELIERPNDPPVLDGRVRLVTGQGTPAARMRLATDRAIVLGHGPLPCPVTISSVATAPGPG